MTKFSFKHQNKRINIDIEECRGLNRAFGLMFGRRERAKALLFRFEKPTGLGIHSLFVFFPFAAIWLDDKNEVIKAKKVMPFTFSVGIKEPFYKIIEIPLNNKYKKFKFLVGD